MRVPNPLLLKHCTPVSSQDLSSGALTELIAEMKHTMIENRGVGLAANQGGHNIAVFTIDERLANEHGVPSVFANPQITEYGRETDVLEEGCLSIPGVWMPIVRSKKIMFKALDEHGTRVKFRARGMLARVLQHETDHLNGVTIKDRAK